MLLRDAPGEDMHDANLLQLKDMVDLLVGIQSDWRDRVGLLLSLGLPDWRGSALIPRIADVVSRTSSQLSIEDRKALAEFVRDLPLRFAEIASCGVPDMLVHGDFHPGNVRGDQHMLTLLDWGDSGVGHPLLDQPAFLERQPTPVGAVTKEFWNDRLLERFPGSDPAKAAHLVAPIATARQAVTYRNFLDNIEPSEQLYHHADPAHWLRRTVALLRR